MRCKFAINEFDSIATMKIWGILVSDNSLRAVVHCYANIILSRVIVMLVTRMHISAHARVYRIVLILAMTNHFVSDCTADNAAGNEVNTALSNDINKIHRAAVDTTGILLIAGDSTCVGAFNAHAVSA